MLQVIRVSFASTSITLNASSITFLSSSSFSDRMSRHFLWPVVVTSFTVIHCISCHICMSHCTCSIVQKENSWIFHVLEETWPQRFISRFLRPIYVDSNTEVEFAGKPGGHFLMARLVRQGCPASAFIFVMVCDPFFDGYMIRSSQETLSPLTFSSPFRAHTLMILRVAVLPVVDDRVSGFCGGGLGWVQPPSSEAVGHSITATVA